MKFKRITALCLVFLIAVVSLPAAVFADDGIALYIDSVPQSMKSPCLIDNGTVYVPLVETFFKLGVYMEWNEKEGCWLGKGNNGEIRIKMDSMTADIDWVDVELPAPTKVIGGVEMVPLYLVEDALRTSPAVYNEKENRIDIVFPDINYKPKQEFMIESILSELPKDGQPLFEEEQLYNLTKDTGGDLMNYEVVDVEGMPFKKAAQIEKLPDKDNNPPTANYSNQMHTTITLGTFESGDVGLMSFWARATMITDESGLAGLRPGYEQLGLWQKAQGNEVKIGPEWKKYYLPLYSGQYTLKAGASHLTFSVGYKAQIIQVADFQMVNFGKRVPVETLIPGTNKAYKGMEEDALWRKEAYRRIEKYRKNDMVIRARDEDGNPVEGVKVSADMTEQEFMIGLEVVKNEILDLNEENSKVGRTRADVLKNYFNAGVCGNEMKFHMDEDGFVIAARMINQWLDWGKRVRGHALAWNDRAVNMMDGYPNVTYDEIYDYQMKAAIGETWMFKDKMIQWDVLNEPHDSNSLRKQYGTQIFSDMFQMVKALDPKAKLYLNETGMEGHGDRNSPMRSVGLLRTIVLPMIEEERAPIDGLGVQGHCTSYLYPQGFYQELNNLAAEVDEVSVTEYDFYNENYDYAPEHMRDTFLATFSHPKATAFIVWGYFDPMHWRSYGLFYDRYWNKKPQMDLWKKMMDEEYATHESTQTGSDGNAVIRGFRGDYNITIEVDGVKKEVPFTLTNAQDAHRDNFIDVIVKNGRVEVTPANTPEVYADGKVEYNSFNEAYADYLATVGDRELIGIYKHSDNEGNTVPKTNDGLMNTYWYAEGDDGYVQYELVKQAGKGDVSIDFRTVNGEVYKYSVQTSKDGEAWTEIYTGQSDEPQVIPFTDTMFIRIQSVGNQYMGISEVNINAEK